MLGGGLGGVLARQGADFGIPAAFPALHPPG